MSEYDEYKAKARGKNQHGNTDHRAQKGGCKRIAVPAVGIITALIVLAVRRVRR